MVFRIDKEHSCWGGAEGRNPRSGSERHQARETGGSHWLSPTSWALIALLPLFAAALLGLTPQALCCRLLRRLKAKILKHRISNNLVYRVISYAEKQVEQFRRESLFKGENYVNIKSYANHLGFLVADERRPSSLCSRG